MVIALMLFYGIINENDYIKKYIYSIISWTVICFAITHILSAYHDITTLNLWLSWGIIDIILLFIFLLRHKKVHKNFLNFSYIKSLSSFQIFWFIFACIIIFLSIKTVPYNYDSMTYHLPRVFHWYENQSVEHYATHIDRQVGSPTLGAYLVLHVYAMLNASDRLVNLVQTFSFLTNGILVYYLIKRIGCSPKYSRMGLILYYTLPIALAEAFTTQVDNISTIWLLSFLYLLVDMVLSGKKLIFNKETFISVASLSFCIVFGFLSKPSVCFGFLIFAIWLLIIVIKRKDSLKAVLCYIFMSIIIIVSFLNIDLKNNIETYKAVMPSNVGQRQLVGTLRPNYLLMNGIKNFTFNLPFAMIYDGSKIIYTLNNKIADLIQVDIDDESISEDGNEYCVHEMRDYGHDTAVNPVISILFLFFWYIFIKYTRKKGMVDIRNVIFVLASIAYIVFCLLLRWEPFVSRYMISYLALLCIGVSGQAYLYFEEVNEKNMLVIKERFFVLFFVVCITEAFGMFCYHGKIAKELSRYSGYFYVNSWIEEDYRNAVNYINSNNITSLGLILGSNSYEYPILVMLNPEIQIQHVNVKNDTVQYENEKFIPEAILTVDSTSDDFLNCHNMIYEKNKSFSKDIALFIRKDAGDF